MQNIKKTVGKNLKHYRQSSGYSQEKMANLIDINIRQLARIEAGGSFVSVDTLSKICDVLNISPAVLFMEKPNLINNNTYYSESFLQLISNLENIADDEMKVEYMNYAYMALFDINVLDKLKSIIYGFDLLRNK